MINLGVAKSCSSLVQKVDASDLECGTKLWNILLEHYAPRKKIAKSRLIMALVRTATTIPEGPWESHSAQLRRDLQRYNATGEPLTVPEIGMALTISSLLVSRHYCTFGALLLNEEDSDFESVDNRTSEFDRNAAIANESQAKANAAVVSDSDSNSGASTVSEQDTKLNKLIDTVSTLLAKVNSASKKALRDPFIAECAVRLAITGSPTRVVIINAVTSTSPSLAQSAGAHPQSRNKQHCCCKTLSTSTRTYRRWIVHGVSKGQLQLTVLDDEDTEHSISDEILYSPDLAHTLISVRQLVLQGYRSEHTPDALRHQDPEKKPVKPSKKKHRAKRSTQESIQEQKSVPSPAAAPLTNVDHLVSAAEDKSSEKLTPVDAHTLHDMTTNAIKEIEEKGECNPHPAGLGPCRVLL
eukprot:1146189-Rhodomonas_salina.1